MVIGVLHIQHVHIQHNLHQDVFPNDTSLRSTCIQAQHKGQHAIVLCMRILCHIVKFCKFPQDRKQKLIEACRKGDTDMVAVVEISPTKLLLCIMCLSMCSSFHFYSIYQIEISNSFISLVYNNSI